MFERLKKVFGQEKVPSAGPAPAVAPGAGLPDGLAQWAAAHGLVLHAAGGNVSFALTGTTAGKPWKLERGSSSRKYIRGDELRARGEISVNDDASVLIMNRPLKDSLEKLAYQMYTDTLQTTADPSLPEEMRWLAMYPEVGWEGLVPGFWARYAVMADKREHASAWLDPALAQLLMNWPQQASGVQVPFILMLLRGKAYLRMQYTPADLPTLEHATRVFTHACEAAIAGLSTDIVL